MSRMSELDIEIREMLDKGISTEYIAKKLDIPKRWVEDVMLDEMVRDYWDGNTGYENPR